MPKKQAQKSIVYTCLDDVTKEKYLGYLNRQKEFFMSIMDEIAVLKVRCKKASIMSFRKSLDVIEVNLHNMEFMAFPYAYSNRYWCVIRFVGECIRQTNTLLADCEILCSGHKVDALDKMQESLENALEYVLDLIEKIENPKTLFLSFKD